MLGIRVIQNSGVVAIKVFESREAARSAVALHRPLGTVWNGRSAWSLMLECFTGTNGRDARATTSGKSSCCRSRSGPDCPLRKLREECKRHCPDEPWCGNPASDEVPYGHPQRPIR